MAPVIGMKNTPTSRVRVDLALGVLGVDVEHLAALERLADGDDHAPTRLHLLEQLGRRVLRRARDDDDVEAARHLGPAVIAVANAGVDVVVAERSEDLRHRVAERLDDLDRVRLLDDAREEGALKAAAGADLERDVVRARLGDLGHVGLAEIVDSAEP